MSVEGAGKGMQATKGQGWEERGRGGEGLRFTDMEMRGAVGMQNLVPGDAQMLLYVCILFTHPPALVEGVYRLSLLLVASLPLLCFCQVRLPKKRERLPSRSKRAPPGRRKHACIL